MITSLVIQHKPYRICMPAETRLLKKKGFARFVKRCE
jgi:hypothetical protein